MTLLYCIYEMQDVYVVRKMIRDMEDLVLGALSPSYYMIVMVSTGPSLYSTSSQGKTLAKLTIR